MTFLRLAAGLVLATLATAQDVPSPPSLPRAIMPTEIVHADGEPSLPAAVGQTWKATFGSAGFCYVPFLGSEADRDHSLVTRLVAVRVGGVSVPFAPEVTARRRGDCYEYDRHGVRERYDLRATEVEQTIEIDTRLPGDVDVVLELRTDLAEDPQRPGIQFANARGAVHYGEAFLLRAGERLPIHSSYAAGLVTLHVPAALRGDGPVVIDPIYTTHVATAGVPTAHGSPDLAYDTTFGVWLLAYELQWSVTDYDIYSQLLDRDGLPIPGSTRVVDATTASCRHPRVANRNDANVFLVVCDRTDPLTAGGQTQVWHLVRDANPGGSATALQLTSSPTAPGPAFSADVGGDPAATGGSPFAVVWVQPNSPANTIQLRWIQANGQPVGTAPTQLVNWGNAFSNLRLSKSNGRGQVQDPMWLAVFSMTMSSSNFDTAALPILPFGSGGGGGVPATIESGVADDRNPSVTIPFAGPGGATRFAITSERQNPRQPRVAVYEPITQSVVGRTDLGTLGVGPYWLRLQSDGLRFVCTSSPDALTVEARTLVCTGATPQWSVVDGPHPLTGTPLVPSIASAAASGGGLTEYGIAYVDAAQPGGRTTVVRFDGREDGWYLSVTGTGCQGLQLDWTGTPTLGSTVTFPLSNFGGDLPVLAFGEPTNMPVPLCGPCQIGLRLDRPIAMFPGLSLLSITIPPQLDLVGYLFAVQGIAVGSGTCLGALKLSDTWWMRVR